MHPLTPHPQAAHRGETDCASNHCRPGADSCRGGLRLLVGRLGARKPPNRPSPRKSTPTRRPSPPSSSPGRRKSASGSDTAEVALKACAERGFTAETGRSRPARPSRRGPNRRYARCAEGDGPRGRRTVKKGQVLLTLTPLFGPRCPRELHQPARGCRGRWVRQGSRWSGEDQPHRVERLVKKSRTFAPARLADGSARSWLWRGDPETGRRPVGMPSKRRWRPRCGGLVEPCRSSRKRGACCETPRPAGSVCGLGCALFEIVSLDPIWVRVPVFVGDSMRSTPRRRPLVTSRNVAGVPRAFPPGLCSSPPSADPLAATVDLFYQVDNKAALPARPARRRHTADEGGRGGSHRPQGRHHP